VRPEGRIGALTMETGSGPEGSSLTVDSQRSLGAGTEESRGVTGDGPGRPPVSAWFLLFWSV